MRDTLQRNGYWALSEKILTAMIWDSKIEMRRKAVSHILRTRVENNQFRQSKIPIINFKQAITLRWSNGIVQLLRNHQSENNIQFLNIYTFL